MLVFVIVLSSLLLLLGSFLVNLSVTESMIASNQERGLQALYLAESGVEATLGVLLENNLSLKGNMGAALGGGHFETETSGYTDERGSRWVRVTSLGYSDNISREVILEFQAVPGTPPEALDGALLGWVEEECGEIKDGLQDSSAEVVKIFTMAPGNGAWLSEESSSSFASPGFYFEGDPALEQFGALVLSAGIVVMRGEVVLGENAALTLEPKEEEPLRLYLEEPIRTANFYVLAEPGVYSFTGAFILNSSTTSSEMEHFRVAPQVPNSERWFFPLHE